MTTRTDPFPEDLEQAAEKAGRYARELFEKSGSWGDNAETIANAIREEPVKAALIAAGVGLLLGMIIKR